MSPQMASPDRTPCAPSLSCTLVVGGTHSCPRTKGSSVGKGLPCGAGFGKNGMSRCLSDSGNLGDPADEFVVWLQQIPQARFYPCKIRFVLVNAVEHFLQHPSMMLFEEALDLTKQLGALGFEFASEAAFHFFQGDFGFVFDQKLHQVAAVLSIGNAERCRWSTDVPDARASDRATRFMIPRLRRHLGRATHVFVSGPQRTFWLTTARAVR